MSRGCEGGWGGDKEVGGEGERERDAFYEVCFIGQFVAEPDTGPLLCRTALWDCFKDTNTASFYWLSVIFINLKLPQIALPYWGHNTDQLNNTTWKYPSV